MQPLTLVKDSPPRRLAPQRRCRANEALLTYVARRLGIIDFSARTIIAKVRLLAEHHHFPLPKNPRFVAGVRQVGPQAIDARSVWDKDAVDLWFDDDRPANESAGLAIARVSSARDELQRRALALVA